MSDNNSDKKFRYIAEIDPLNIDPNRVITALTVVTLGAIVLGIVTYFI